MHFYCYVVVDDHRVFAVFFTLKDASAYLKIAGNRILYFVDGLPQPSTTWIVNPGKQLRRKGSKLPSVIDTPVEEVFLVLTENRAGTVCDGAFAFHNDAVKFAKHLPGKTMYRVTQFSADAFGSEGIQHSATRVPTERTFDDMKIRYSIDHDPHGRTYFRATSDFNAKNPDFDSDGIYVFLNTSPGETVRHVGYPHVLVDSQDPLKLHLGWLLQHHEPKGSARAALCKLMQAGFAMGVIERDDLVWLEASGEVDGDFTLLVRMYERMGFTIYAHMDEGIYARVKAGLPITQAYLQNLETTMNARGEEFLGCNMLMAQRAGGLLDWCQNNTKLS